MKNEEDEEEEEEEEERIDIHEFRNDMIQDEIYIQRQPRLRLTREEKWRETTWRENNNLRLFG